MQFPRMGYDRSLMVPHSCACIHTHVYPSKNRLLFYYRISLFLFAMKVSIHRLIVVAVVVVVVASQLPRVFGFLRLDLLNLSSANQSSILFYSPHTPPTPHSPPFHPPRCHLSPRSFYVVFLASSSSSSSSTSSSSTSFSPSAAASIELSPTEPGSDFGENLCYSFPDIATVDSLEMAALLLPIFSSFLITFSSQPRSRSRAEATLECELPQLPQLSQLPPPRHRIHRGFMKNGLTNRPLPE